MNRRAFVSSGFAALAGTAFAERVNPIGVSLKQEPLAFSFDALEPFLDAASVEVHYDQIHASILNKLRQTLTEVHLEVGNIVSLIPAIKTTPTPPNPNSVLNFSKKPGPLPEETQQQIRKYAGGHLNHTAFWRFLAPPGSGPTEPEGPVAEAIRAEFGSIDAFKAAFTEAALAHPGQGWTWLVYRPNGRLVITTTSANDNPLMQDFVPAAETGRPILCLDLWDHALSLRHKRSREGYVAAWWNVVNYAFMSKAYAIVTSS